MSHIGYTRAVPGIIRLVRKTQVIPSEWNKAVTIFIPKEKDSQSVNLFRGIDLVNVEGKVFAIMAKRRSSFLLANYVDTSCQNAGVPGLPGSVEHLAMI